MNLELTIAFDICACLLCAFCLVYQLRKKSARDKQNKVFLLTIANLMASAVFAVIANLIQQVPSLHVPKNRPILYIALMCYFLLHNALPAIYAYYMRIVISLDAGASRRGEALFFTPAGVALTIIMMNPILHWVFQLTPEMTFERQWMEYALYLIGIFYLAVVFFYLARYHIALLKRTIYALGIFYAMTLFGVVFQLIYPRMKVELFLEALSLLGLMQYFEEDDALRDSVTGVFNRMAFRQDVTRLLTTGHSFTLININFLNMRFYSRIMNVETFHNLLNNIAVWLRSLKVRGYIYHFDENFTLLLFGLREEKVKELVNRIGEKLEQPFYSGSTEAKLQSFLSVVNAPEDVDSIDVIMDLLEYEPNNRGARVTIQYRESLTYIKREAAVERALRNAVSRHSFQVYYQPIYSIEEDRIVSAEALVRLFDSELGQISPAEFIPVAEKSALIVDIGYIVTDKVCAFLKTEEPSKYGIEYIEVNLSVAQLMQNNFVENMARILDKHQVAADKINLEITESVASDSSEPFMVAVRQLEELGFTFSMDDYGTGYSNIASILNVNFKNIKMDKTFLEQAQSSNEGATILRDTTLLIRHLGRNVLQEGVETEEELNFVKEAGCNLIQGFYFSKPVPAEDFLEYVRNFNQK